MTRLEAGGDVVSSKLKDILAAELHVKKEEIFDDTELVGDLGADSITIIDVLLETENEFNIGFDDVEMDNVHTFGMLVALVRKQLEAV